MKLVRLALAALILSVATTACSSEITGPSEPGTPVLGQGTYGTSN